jgi:hypothetical protein
VPPSPPVKCKDPGGALTLKTEPVLSFPANRTFTPDGNVAISELTNPPVISMPMDGSMTVLFETVPEHPGTIKATIQSLNFSFGSITLLNGDSTGSNTVIRHGDQSISIDRASGATIGKLWTRAGNSLGMFETDSPITGNMDFNSGKWTILTNNANNCVRCDINGDGQVDSTDISIILDSRGASSGPNDSRDVDSDGQITTNDARICSLACTHPNCAK